ncbi:hypothetical protein [Sabulicella rubraurantiaca]|uniref:hypothetical protein n=1 Tax=Sabulicella rubraurantiaca TaxID=2811429 RepID=UPI001A95F4D0|nr:hypothetical protein [Sabulicella rubraurantiaca]
MTAQRRTLLLLALTLPAIAACGRQAALVSEVDGEFQGPGNLSDRALQIRRAGASLGWSMSDFQPGLMRGTLNLRSHQAVVDIPYDRNRFRIRYVDSTNLNASAGTIHPNYNSWVQNLRNAIMRESAMGGFSPARH